MREVLKVIAVVVLAVVAGGCASLTKGLGDGKIAGVVDVGAIAGAANLVRPGTGDAINTGEAALANAMGKGPFGNLPYTVERTGTLKDGRQFTEADIADLRETYTPIVPDAIVKQIPASRLWDAPTPTNTPAE